MALRGCKVIEMAGLAPAPFCGMILRDHGATVTRIDKPGTKDNTDTLSRGKRSLILDLKKYEGIKVLSRLCSTADVLIDPFRPGVMEKHNLGPSELCKLNPRLIYARLTGFGQQGPYAKMAGHDLNYIAISGILSTLGGKGKPIAPINLMGDFAGGGLICALGICLALLDRHSSGKGQVIDANMVEGSAYVSTWLWTTRSDKFPIPFWAGPRGHNLLDGGSHFYQTYETKDGKFMAVGALEPQFYAALLKGLGLDPEQFSQFYDWEVAAEKIAEVFRTKTQGEWCKIFDFTDACVTPIVPLEEAHTHPHNASNASFCEEDGIMTPIVAPRMSRTSAETSLKKPIAGQHTSEVLLEEGFEKHEIDSMINDKIIYSSHIKSKL